MIDRDLIERVSAKLRERYREQTGYEEVLRRCKVCDDDGLMYQVVIVNGVLTSHARKCWGCQKVRERDENGKPVEDLAGDPVFISAPHPSPPDGWFRGTEISAQMRKEKLRRDECVALGQGVGGDGPVERPGQYQ